MLRRVVELALAHQRSCSCRLERFVEGALGVRVEIVANDNHFFALGVATFNQARHLNRPIHFGLLLPNGDLSPLGQRFSEHEDIGNFRTFVFVVDAFGVLLCCGNRALDLLDQLNGFMLPRIVFFLPHRSATKLASMQSTGMFASYSRE